jgi:hypothetical protein
LILSESIFLLFGEWRGWGGEGGTGLRSKTKINAKKKISDEGCGCSSVVERMPTVSKAHDLILSTAKN